MIFPLLTLLTSLALAGVAGWFSIVGLTAILAGQPIPALILGITLEIGKLVTTSWLYRNWKDSTWYLKGPLIYFTITIMLVTSMGVFGFLSKAHLEQGAPTMDNAAKIERLNQQIEREKSLIADNDKVIAQLDAAVNSFIGKDKAERAISVRKSQSAQRKQLKEDSDATQKRIEAYNDEKFKLESEVRKLQLEVGPIRYIAQLVYGESSTSTSALESAVRMFTLLIVSTLDPLAIVLLIAANFSLLKLQNEKNKKISAANESNQEANYVESTANPINPENDGERASDQAEIVTEYKEEAIDNIEEILPIVPPEEEAAIHEEIHEESVKDSNVDDFDWITYAESNVIEKESVEEEKPIEVITEAPKEAAEEKLSVAEAISNIMITPWAAQASTLRELLGNTPHFVPQKINDDIEHSEQTIENTHKLQNNVNTVKHPKVSGWLNEFKGN